MTRTGERRSKLQKALSALLAVLMLLGVVGPGVSLLAYADDSGRIRSAQWNDIVIAVPETVYMTPQYNFSDTTTSVQYYVNNTVSSSGAVSVDAVNNATAGKFYIYSQYIKSVNSVAVDNATLSGLSATKNGNLFSDDSFTMTLKSGNELASKGKKTLEWTITCTMTDNTTATFYAYTIAYNPYLSAVVSSAWCHNTRNNNHTLDGFAWTSGIHGIEADGNWYTIAGCSPLGHTITSGGGSSSAGDDWFYDNCIFSSVQFGQDKKNAYYWDYDWGGYWSGRETDEVQEVTPWGLLTVDTSRNTNLNTIPNITTGFHVTGTGTKSKQPDIYGYICNLTESVATKKDSSGRITSGADHWQDSRIPTWYKERGTILWGSSAETGQWIVKSDSCRETQSVLWNCSVTGTGTQYCYTKTGLYSKDGSEDDRSFINLVGRVKVTKVDKSGWRTAVNNAQKYGFQRSWFTSASDYDDWKASLKAVYEKLCDPTNSTAPDTSTLSTRTNNLAKQYNGTGTNTGNWQARVHDFGVVKVLSNTGTFNNEWKVILLPDASNTANTVSNPIEIETVHIGDKVRFLSRDLSAAPYSSFTYLGNMKIAGQKDSGETFINANVSTGLGISSSLTGYNSTDFTYNHITQTQLTNGEHRRAFYYQGKDVTVTINPNGGSWNGSTANSTITGSYKTEWALKLPDARTGYTFDGWEHTVGTDSTYDSTTGIFVFGQSPATLKAKWKPIDYSISYTLNGGAVSTANPTSYNADSATFTLHNPTKTGYTFAGWTGTNGTTPQTTVTISQGSTGDRSYTANWTANGYTVSFDGNGATGGSMNPQSFTYGTSQALTANAFSRAYTVTYRYNDGVTADTTSTATATFNGWATSASGSVVYTNGQSVSNLTAANGGNVTIFANWTLGSVTLPTPAYTNHVFDGWYSDSALQTFVGAGGASYTPSANATLYAKWTRPAKDDSYVLDYGLPVDLAVLSNDIPDATLKSVTASGSGYNAVKSGSVIRFTPTAVLNDAVTFTYTVTYGSADYTASVTVIPANNVYYEESFISFENGGGVTWTADGSAFANAFQEGARPGDEASPVYGFDSTYDNKNATTYSLGTAMYAEVNATNKGGATATFTFTGTGFDFYSVTNNQSGLAFVDVYKQNANVEGGWENIESTMVNTYFGYKYGLLYLDENDKVTLTETSTPIYYAAQGDTGADTFFINGTQRGTKTNTGNPASGWVAGEGAATGVFQVPVISRTGLTYGTYKVVVEPRWSARQNMTGGTSYKFYVDAVRVYDPINPATITSGTTVYNAYAAENELNATYKSVREQLKSSFGETGGNGNAGVVLLETGDTTCTPAEYQNIGPKNEVYLNPGQAIAFHLTTSSATAPAKVSVGLKMASGSGEGEATVYGNGSKTLAVNGATELYQDISSVMAENWKDADGVKTTNSPIIIRNTGSGVLSITNLKWSYAASVPAAGRMLSFSFAPQDLTTASAVLRQATPEPETVTPDAPIAPQYPQADSGRRMLTLQALLEMIFGNFFRALRTAFFKK